MTYDNIFFAVNYFDTGSGGPVLRAVLLRVHCCVHKIPPTAQHTVGGSRMLETPRLRFPNKPEQLAILPLIDRYITVTSFAELFSFDNQTKIEKRQAVKEKEKTLRERLFSQCFNQCFFPCKFGRISIHNPRRRLFSIQPPVEREKEVND